MSMTTINVYLTFNGNCEAAFNFYQKVFKGSEMDLGKFGEMPENPDYQVVEEEKDRVMHVSLKLNESTVLMGCDTGLKWASEFLQGNNFSVSLNVDSKNDADALFAALSVSGSVQMPMSYTFWNSYYGMLTDQFGIQWMISFDK